LGLSFQIKEEAMVVEPDTMEDVEEEVMVVEAVVVVASVEVVVVVDMVVVVNVVVEAAEEGAEELMGPLPIAIT
jgi:hypothetical protein